MLDDLRDLWRVLEHFADGLVPQVLHELVAAGDELGQSLGTEVFDAVAAAASVALLRVLQSFLFLLRNVVRGGGGAGGVAGCGELLRKLLAHPEYEGAGLADH